MRNPFGTCILLTINALPLCFLLADGTFVAATVYGGNCKVFPGVPGADRGIYVFGSLYALRQYIFRVGGIYGKCNPKAVLPAPFTVLCKPVR